MNSHSEHLIPCLSDAKHTTIRTAAAQSLTRMLFDSDEKGDGITFALGAGVLPPLTRACVDKELIVAASAFKGVSYVVTAGSKHGREAAGLVLAAKMVADTMIAVTRLDYNPESNPNTSG